MENMNNIENFFISLIKRVIIVGVLIMWAALLITIKGCTITSYIPDPVYEDHTHTTEIYYHDKLVYFGYWEGFYYYYGVPHFYPWWYYYQYLPPQNYYIHHHIHVHCDNGYYVYGHRGPIINNQEIKDFKPTIKVKNKKDKSFVFPENWKSYNSTRTNKQSKVNYNINKINYNRTFNISYKNNKNKGNGSTRPNKTTTTRKPKK